MDSTSDDYSSRRQRRLLSLGSGLVAGAVVLSPGTAGAAANLDEPAAPARAFAPAASASDPAPEGALKPYLGEWLTKMARDNSSDAVLEKVKEWTSVAVIAGLAGTPLAPLAPLLAAGAKSGVGSAASMLLAGLWGEKPKEMTNEQLFAKISAQFEDVQKRLNQLEQANNRNTDRIMAKIDKSDFLAASNHLVPYVSRIRAAAKSAKLFAETMNQHLQGKDVERLKATLDNYNGQYGDEITKMSATSWRATYMTHLVGRGQSTGVIQKYQRALSKQYPLITSELSQRMADQWTVHYAEFQLLWAMLLPAAAGKSDSVFQTMKAEYTAGNEALLSLYPAVVPEGTAFSAETGQWFAVNGGAYVFHAATQDRPQPYAAWRRNVNDAFASWKTDHPGLLGFDARLMTEADVMKLVKGQAGRTSSFRAWFNELALGSPFGPRDWRTPDDLRKLRNEKPPMINCPPRANPSSSRGDACRRALEQQRDAYEARKALQQQEDYVVVGVKKSHQDDDCSWFVWGSYCRPLLNRKKMWKMERVFEVVSPEKGSSTTCESTVWGWKEGAGLDVFWDGTFRWSDLNYLRWQPTNFCVGNLAVEFKVQGDAKDFIHKGPLATELSERLFS